jgi:hypothetical protein
MDLFYSDLFSHFPTFSIPVRMEDDEIRPTEEGLPPPQVRAALRVEAD